MAQRNAAQSGGDNWNPASAVYSPSEAITYGIQHVERQRDGSNRAVKFPIPVVDTYFAPLLGGQIAGIIAQTSNMKSGMMHFWERELAKQLVAEGRDEVVVHISVEETVEEQALLAIQQESGLDAGDLAQGNFDSYDKLIDAATTLMGVPIWRVGDSIARAEDMAHLHLSNIMRSLDAMKKEFDKPITFAAIFIDYLQALPFDPDVAKLHGEGQRRLQVRNDVYRARQMAAIHNCPVIMGVQAKQNLSGRPYEGFDLPGTYDGEETASIAQRFDRIWSQWLVKTTKAPDDVVEFNGNEIAVTENLMFGRVCKQRGRLPAGRIYPLYVSYDSNTIHVMANP